MRVYNPKKAQWKLQVVWAIMIGLCCFFIFVFFSCIINYWEHVEAVGTDTFLQAYLINTLLIQAFACEFREIFNVVFANIILREVLMLFCCLRCASATSRSTWAAPRAARAAQAGAAITRDAAARARRGEARGLMHHLSQMRESVRESITGLLAPPKPRLLLAGSEEMLFLALRTALTKHTLALSQLRAAKRAWRYQHIFSAGGPGSARDELLKGLDAAREGPEWVQLRHLRIREHIRALVESEHATVNSVQQTYANQLATLLTSSELAARGLRRAADGRAGRAGQGRVVCQAEQARPAAGRPAARPHAGRGGRPLPAEGGGQEQLEQRPGEARADQHHEEAPRAEQRPVDAAVAAAVATARAGGRRRPGDRAVAIVVPREEEHAPQELDRPAAGAAAAPPDEQRRLCRVRDGRRREAAGLALHSEEHPRQQPSSRQG